MEHTRIFKCLSCGEEFVVGEQERTIKCPSCRGKTVIMIEGDPLPKAGSGCSPSG